MRQNLSDFLNFYQISTALRLFATGQVAERVAGRRLPELEARLKESREHDEKTLELEVRWDSQNDRRRYGPRAQELDGKLDRALSGFMDQLRGATKLYDEDDPRRRAAVLITEAFFPSGLAKVSRARFAEQYIALERMEKKHAKDPELQRALQNLNLEDAFALIRELRTSFGEEVRGSKLEAVRFEQLQEARAQGIAKLARVIIAILMLEDFSLLEPIEAQNEAVKAQRRGRKAPIDDLVIDDAVIEAPNDPVVGDIGEAA